MVVFNNLFVQGLILRRNVVGPIENPLDDPHTSSPSVSSGTKTTASPLSSSPSPISSSPPSVLGSPTSASDNQITQIVAGVGITAGVFGLATAVCYVRRALKRKNLLNQNLGMYKNNETVQIPGSSQIPSSSSSGEPVVSKAFRFERFVPFSKDFSRISTFRSVGNLQPNRMDFHPMSFQNHPVAAAYQENELMEFAPQRQEYEFPPGWPARGADVGMTRQKNFPSVPITELRREGYIQ